MTNAAEATRQATVISGANEQVIDLPEGQVTVTDLVARVGEFMNIRRDNQQVQINGETARYDQVVQPGDRVEFVRAAGQKA